AEADRDEAVPSEPEPEVLATFRPWWVVFNLFSIWAYLTAAGLLWGLFWFVSMFGVDLAAFVRDAVDWSALGWFGTTVVALVVTGLIGAVGMGVNFLAGYWRFELSRVRSGGRSYLRTRRGLFSTREVSRDVKRMRGLTISEPLPWRWMGMADTNVITTGLSVWDLEEPTAILPRGPIRVARDVATRVLGDPCPLDAPLTRHPRAALRRRLWWATLVAAVPAAALAVPVASGIVPPWPLWIVLALWVLALLLAVVAYRALGHAIAGDYLVVRAGVVSRSTSALRRDAVSTIAVRQSILQRRLGLSTVAAMTAAGWSAYEAPDVAAADSLALADAAAPGLLDEFVTTAAEGR
ncbi:PH domain-containing protein, partial [Pseudactinotalea sp.]|uniref:PH domain-containing protein n=1 Tax=Pseudactinotalea sp. TaxID=1926260 RepID=UPI003B3A8107